MMLYSALASLALMILKIAGVDIGWGWVFCPVIASGAFFTVVLVTALVIGYLTERDEHDAGRAGGAEKEDH